MDQNIHQIVPLFKNFPGDYTTKLTICLYKNMSKNTLKRINCDMFSNVQGELSTSYHACSYNHYYLYKKMIIFDNF